jgi:hypothetical protein
VAETVIGRMRHNCVIEQAAQDDAATVFIENDKDSYSKPIAGTRLTPSLVMTNYNVTLFDEAHCTEIQ